MVLDRARGTHPLPLSFPDLLPDQAEAPADCHFACVARATVAS